MAAARDLKGLFGRLLVALDVGVAVVAATLVLAIYLAPDAASSSGPLPAEGTFELAVRGNGSFQLLALLAGVLLVANFLWLIYGTTPHTPPTHVVSEAPGGTVRVARDAIESGLRTAGEALDEVSRLRVVVDTSVGMKKIFVAAQFHAPEGVRIHDASSVLRGRLIRRFGELVRLPEGHRLEVELEFLGFIGRASKKALAAEEAAARAEPEEPDVPFTGPRYPIDGDDESGS